MSLYEASFRVKHECPYREISERYPDLTIREWYLDDCQVIEITAPGSPTDDLLDEIDRLGTVLHESVDNAGLHVVTQSCLCSLEDSIIERFEAHNCLYQPPTIHRQGWEHYSVIAFDESDIRELLHELEADRDIEVLSKTAITAQRVPHSMLAPVDQLFEDVTERQMAALRLALESGYYEQPRKTSLRELADQTAVARSTYEEHLRKAENKILTSAGQFLRLVTATSTADPLEVEKTRQAEQAAD
ncbi:XRE family transcriptional regulator (plasmid) [Haloferax mediterranei ATCC 33500]|uniref:Transcription regulator-like protein n=1 Tax=Haloferax mediterranei (strain ATCC 33500 / DSM 1411 / JCM 8866 / NBRC 14739 / NCIMB 2177 / R-4) TaxID=523841 RepID=I3R8Z1_HALMT|nr:helix-turn-helix domain-containing protein [Haloferax mediterranei]AFK20701.1 transcription regulator-like protein [Haloferax mediterranei ATCC 33500]AHZ24042.1 XRE family transcriptional regulator [Haloferax mediterranei ATCC 33500]ELZ97628.1 transcription regulator-like protein [Haloferax mediterranei ATCC 33500]MDX5989714.1 helix-turn-helix domain-containing protein [Haloferax mediterranei ATCC 33500]QCQ77386.1 XRE family transcriptional regulator [Haloferax mediterranei ATCC 33500]